MRWTNGQAIMLCVGCVMGGCGDETTSDPCESSQATKISVQVRVALSGQDPATQPTFSSDKVPCGGVVKGEFDLPATVAADGSVLSHWAGYDLNNTKDVVRIHYDVTGLGAGMRILTYDQLKPFDGSTYVLNLN